MAKILKIQNMDKKNTQTVVSEPESDENEQDGTEEEESDEDMYAENLNSSSTSSTDGEEDLEEDEETLEQDPVSSKREKIRIKILQRYEHNKGKRLYLRFGEKLPPEDDKLLKKVKALSSLVKDVSRPRQKSARFCIINFNSEEDCKTALENIRETIKQSEDKNIKSIHIDMVRTESSEFLESIAEKKIKNQERKKAMRKLKKAQLTSGHAKKFTSTLIVTNLPQRTSMLEVRTAFPKAVDVRIKRNKAAISFPTTHEARNAYKQSTSLGGVLLKVRFDNPHKRKPKKQISVKSKISTKTEENNEMKTMKKVKKTAK